MLNDKRQIKVQLAMIVYEKERKRSTWKIVAIAGIACEVPSETAGSWPMLLVPPRSYSPPLITNIQLNSLPSQFKLIFSTDFFLLRHSMKFLSGFV